VEIRSRTKSGCRNSMDHSPISQNGKVERRPVESDELRRERRDLVHEGRNQLFLGPLPDVRCPERIHDPATAIVAMGDQRPDTDDRVVDVLGELVPHFGTNFVIALADVAVGGGEALKSGTVSISQTMTLLMYATARSAVRQSPVHEHGVGIIVKNAFAALADTLQLSFPEPVELLSPVRVQHGRKRNVLTIERAPVANLLAVLFTVQRQDNL
jgi:hypothetical protein